MLIPEKYKTELDQIRSDIMEKIAEGPAEVANYVNFVISSNDFSEEECKHMSKTAAKLLGFDFDIEKLAKVDFDKFAAPATMVMPKQIGAGLALAAGFIGLTEAFKGIRQMIENKSADSTFQEVLDENPSIKKDKNAQTYFNTIKKFAPRAAGDKHILETALQHANEFGRLDYPVVKDLIQIQQGAVGPTQPAGSTASTVSNIAKTLTGISPVNI